MRTTDAPHYVNTETGLVPAWAIGFGIRFGLHSDPDNSGQYIAYYLFIVLSVSRLHSSYTG